MFSICSDSTTKSARIAVGDDGIISVGVNGSAAELRVFFLLLSPFVDVLAMAPVLGLMTMLLSLDFRFQFPMSTGCSGSERFGVNGVGE